jgi:hypothetical protein
VASNPRTAFTAVSPCSSVAIANTKINGRLRGGGDGMSVAA